MKILTRILALIVLVSLSFSFLGLSLDNKINLSAPNCKKWCIEGGISVCCDPSGQQNIEIYPNPTKDIFNIETRNVDVLNFTIYDLKGQIIKQYLTPDSKAQFTIEQTGTFILKMQTEKGVVTKKIVKL